MRNIIFTLTIILSLPLSGQNDSIEKATIYNQFLSEKITLDEYRKKGRKWNETIKSFGTYPQSPVNDEGKVQYDYNIHVKDWSKEKLFKKTMEWLAINHGMIPTYVYSSLEDGKIIYSTSGPFKLSYTFVITIKKENVIIEYHNVSFERTTGGYYNSNDVWIPEKTLPIDINHIFPIVNNKPTMWPLYLVKVKGMNNHFNNSIDVFIKYIDGSN